MPAQALPYQSDGDIIFYRARECGIIGLVTTTADDLPDDIAALQAALIAERARAARVEAELAVAKAKASDDQALIAHQRLQIEKLTRQIYGQRSERTVRLLSPSPTYPQAPQSTKELMVKI